MNDDDARRAFLRDQKIERYPARVERLRKAITEDGKPLSQPKLYRRAERLGFDTVRGLERDPYSDDQSERERARYPTPTTLEAIAAALDVDPAEFPEYRLARFRQLFDERTVGLDEAWANYGEFIAGLRLLATQSATELDCTARSDETTEATDGEVRSLLEARRRRLG